MQLYLINIIIFSHNLNGIEFELVKRVKINFILTEINFFCIKLITRFFYGNVRDKTTILALILL